MTDQGDNCEPPSAATETGSRCEPLNVPVPRQWDVVLALPGQPPRRLGTVEADNASAAAALVFERRPLLPPSFVTVGGMLCADLVKTRADKSTRKRQTKAGAEPRRDPASKRRGTLTKAQANAVSERWRRYWLDKHPPDKPPQTESP